MKRIFFTILLLLHVIGFGQVQPLHVSSNGRYLQKEDGSPFFPLFDTGWRISYRLNRSQVDFYLTTRHNQKFTGIAFCLYEDYDSQEPSGGANVYGDHPFNISNGHYVVTSPITTPGNDPNDATQYDYWDHIDYIIDRAASLGMYVCILPTWADYTINGDGGYTTGHAYITENDAYAYGHWLGERYANRNNIIWMMGGDTEADGEENIYRAMAEGLADGKNGGTQHDGQADYSNILISYHPRKNSHSSSYWFHNDSWLAFNSFQELPTTQTDIITADWNRTPTKPVWLFEGAYDERPGYGAWACRFQAWQTVFAGAFGHTYGHMKIYGFFSGWENKLNAESANDMQYLYDLMERLTPEQFFNRVPAPDILDGFVGNVYNGGNKSSMVIATKAQDGSFLYVYAANGGNIRVKMDQLPFASVIAKWYDPHNGQWTNIGTIQAGNGAPIHEFDPPGAPADDNDWVLVIEPGNNAEFISQNIPAQVCAGDTFTVEVTFRNSGGTTWTDTDNYHLGSQNPQDNLIWGINRTTLPYDVAPNDTVTFTFDVIAPDTPGVYPMQWRMVQDGVEWFGDYSENINIEVTLCNKAKFLSQNIPTQVCAGDTFTVEVAFKNSGSTVWTSANNYFLGSQNPQDNLIWGINRVTLPYDVAPNDTVTFTFDVIAPDTPGVYPMQWRMVQDGVEWFGDSTQNVNITVSDCQTNNAMLKNDQTLKIYPNPSNGLLSLNLSNEQNYQVIVLNIVGKVVKKKEIRNSKKSIIDLRNLNEGVYIIKVKTKTQTFTQKVIVKKP